MGGWPGASRDFILLFIASFLLLNLREDPLQDKVSIRANHRDSQLLGSGHPTLVF